MSDKEELKAFIMGIISTEGDEPAADITQKLSDVIERKSQKFAADIATNFQLENNTQ